MNNGNCIQVKQEPVEFDLWGNPVVTDITDQQSDRQNDRHDSTVASVIENHAVLALKRCLEKQNVSLALGSDLKLKLAATHKQDGKETTDIKVEEANAEKKVLAVDAVAEDDWRIAAMGLDGTSSSEDERKDTLQPERSRLQTKERRSKSRSTETSRRRNSRSQSKDTSKRGKSRSISKETLKGRKTRSRSKDTSRTKNETKSKDTSRDKKRSRSRSRKRKEPSRKGNRSRSRSRKRKRSRSRSRDRGRKKARSRSRSRKKKRSRSRSSSAEFAKIYADEDQLPAKKKDPLPKPKREERKMEKQAEKKPERKASNEKKETSEEKNIIESNLPKTLEVKWEGDGHPYLGIYELTNRKINRKPTWKQVMGRRTLYCNKKGYWMISMDLDEEYGETRSGSHKKSFPYECGFDWWSRENGVWKSLTELTVKVPGSESDATENPKSKSVSEREEFSIASKEVKDSQKTVEETRKKTMTEDNPDLLHVTCKKGK